MGILLHLRLVVEWLQIIAEYHRKASKNQLERKEVMTKTKEVARLGKNKSTPENREFWEFVERTARNVEQNFPLWKRGDYCVEGKSESNDLRKKAQALVQEYECGGCEACDFEGDESCMPDNIAALKRALK